MKLIHHRSNRGTRSFDDTLLPRLTFEPFASLTPAGASAIRARVEGLVPKDDHLVVFRGQQRASTQGLCRLPAERREFVFASLRNAAAAHYHQMEGHGRYKFAWLGMEKAVANQAEAYRVATPLDTLVDHHQKTTGNPLLISASRSLSVAAGDYYCESRSQKSNNPYIYVLQVPKGELVNVHALHMTWCDRVAEQIDVCKAGGLEEAEVSVWLDARPFVVGVYDARRESWL